jgi:hypothetical protein
MNRPSQKTEIENFGVHPLDYQVTTPHLDQTKGLLMMTWHLPVRNDK